MPIRGPARYSCSGGNAARPILIANGCATCVRTYSLYLDSIAYEIASPFGSFREGGYA